MASRRLQNCKGAVRATVCSTPQKGTGHQYNWIVVRTGEIFNPLKTVRPLPGRRFQWRMQKFHSALIATSCLQLFRKHFRCMLYGPPSLVLLESGSHDRFPTRGVFLRREEKLPKKVGGLEKYCRESPRTTQSSTTIEIMTISERRFAATPAPATRIRLRLGDVITERMPDDEGAVAIESYTKDLTAAQLERERQPSVKLKQLSRGWKLEITGCAICAPFRSRKPDLKLCRGRIFASIAPNEAQPLRRGILRPA